MTLGKEAGASSRERKILRLLSESAEPLMAKQIAKRLHVTAASLWPVIARLKRLGSIRHIRGEGYTMSRREVIDCDGCAKSNLHDPVEITVGITPRVSDGTSYATEVLHLCNKCAVDVIKRLLDETRDYKKNRTWVDDLKARGMVARTGFKSV